MSDVFNVISERMDAVRKPVLAVLETAHEMPAGPAFMAFAILFETAMRQYDVFLEVSARIAEKQTLDAARELEDAPRIVTSH